MKLDDIEKLSNAVTEGPWTEEYENSGYIMAHQKGGGHDICKMTTGGTKADAAFIAASRDMTPKLIKLVRIAADTLFCDDPAISPGKWDMCGVCPACLFFQLLEEVEKL